MQLINKRFLLFSIALNFAILNCAEDDVSARCEWPDDETESSSFASSSFCSDEKEDTEPAAVDSDDGSEDFGPYVSAPSISSKPDSITPKGFLAGFLALICSWLCLRSR